MKLLQVTIRLWGRWYPLRYNKTVCDRAIYFGPIIIFWEPTLPKGRIE